VTLLADVNHTGSQKDVVSPWEPAHSLVEDAKLNKEEGTILEVTGATD